MLEKRGGGARQWQDKISLFWQYCPFKVYFRWKIGNVMIDLLLLADLPSSWSCPENSGSVKSSFWAKYVKSGSVLPAWSRGVGGPWSTANSEWTVSEMCTFNFLQTFPLVSKLTIGKLAFKRLGLCATLLAPSSIDNWKAYQFSHNLWVALI